MDFEQARKRAIARGAFETKEHPQVRQQKYGAGRGGLEFKRRSRPGRSSSGGRSRFERRLADVKEAFGRLSGSQRREVLKGLPRESREALERLGVIQRAATSGRTGNMFFPTD